MSPTPYTMAQAGLLAYGMLHAFYQKASSSCMYASTLLFNCQWWMLADGAVLAQNFLLH